MHVDVDWRGSREPLPADIDLSAFRIIQEAVTNVVRHAGTGQCQVSIGQQDGHLSIEVTDSGRGGSPAGTGYGITGMRERATLLGGDFSAGPRPGGGFRVTARLPVPAGVGTMTIRVILADDQPLVRAGLRMLIAQTPDIDVVGEAGTGTEAVQLTRDTGPDVVVMDIRMPGMDGIEATQLITAGAAPPGCSCSPHSTTRLRLRRAAGRGERIMVKDMALEDILTAIRVVAAGDAIIAPGVTRRLIGQFADQPRSRHKPRELTEITEREREVLKLVGLGMSNTEIAAVLYITAGTAKTHVARLLAKLDARDRVQLVITAYETGLVTAPHGQTLGRRMRSGTHPAPACSADQPGVPGARTKRRPGAARRDITMYRPPGRARGGAAAAELARCRRHRRHVGDHCKGGRCGSVGDRRDPPVAAAVTCRAAGGGLAVSP